MSSTITTVSFHGDELQAVYDGDRVWVPLKRVCESLSIDEEGQRQKLRGRPWANTCVIKAVAEDGRNRELFCLDLDSLPMWLATVDTRRAKVAHEKLVDYQRECARALRDHFFGKAEKPIPPPLPSKLSDATSAAHDALIRIGVRDGIATAAILTVIERHTGVAMEAARLALPADTTPSERLNPTKLGAELGITAREVNLRLLDAGLQTKGERDAWMLTEAGKKYGEAVPFANGKHAGNQLLWSRDVLEVLK